VENNAMTEVRGDIVLSFPAQSTNLRIARLTASSVATDLGFGLDDTEDLRVAVTELAGALIDDDDAGGDARLELRFRVDGDTVVVEGRRSSVDGEVPDLDPIARELLNVTTDEHTLRTEDGDWTFSVRKGPSAAS
jgi:serine/threonine-protein kinase RsbW